MLKKRLTAMFLAFALVLSAMPAVSFAAIANDDPELTAYLQEASETRGFEITVEDFEDYLLEYWGAGLEDWTDFAELEENLGEVIKADLSNLNDVYEYYEIDEAGMLQILEENGDSLEHYIYVDDLDMNLDFYINGDSFEDDMGDMFAELGLTEEELEKLAAHFEKIAPKLEDPAVQQRLEELGQRMENFPSDFESIDELTDEQITEIISIYDELLNIFELSPKFYLKKGDELKPITLKELFLMKDPQGYNLWVELYNLQGELILDMEITAEMIGGEIIDEIGEDIVEVPKVVDKIKDQPKKPKTEKGGKLPNTASDYGTNGLAGLAIAAAGFVIYRRVRKTA
ncbi:processed acidic surface protein [Fictibacillus aquaticus]|uniref:Processed acidic surface protein n=1 Tax=Fictibacillus aquaticus TaxID=2021314 RepID=A0A235F9X5_9BACL|nr:processed acidic surface protein [Fictibacillus aquaticus]OYD57737.1 processed acidic surface protein [Fictibacillus aquaticus]